jgi:hypothetical protein
LTIEGRLLGWDSHEAVEEFHQRFARWANPCEVLKGAGRSGSAYYVDGHYLRLLARERHVLAYTHEVAHSVLPVKRGQGHTPLWAGTYIVLLRRIDPYAADLLRQTFRDARLTISVEPWVLTMLRDVPNISGVPSRRRKESA